MTDLKRLRLVCGLRQLDICVGTGIPIQKLSQAERGRFEVLSDPERELLKTFLHQRCERLLREDRERVQGQGSMVADRMTAMA